MEAKKTVRKRNLSVRIYEALKEKILTGALQEGEQLQPIREYAIELEVSKNTIHAAYNRLVEEGYAYAVQGSGYFVGHANEVTLQQLPKAAPIWCDFTQPVKMDFPWEAWKAEVVEAIETVSAADCRQDNIQPNRKATETIKQEITTYLGKMRGVKVCPEQIVLCNGIEDAVGCVRELFHNIADEIAFLEPCHPQYRDLFQEDLFQLKRFDRMAKGGKYPEHAFRILFCYLEQFLQEQAETSAYQGWLSEWIAQTGSYVLLFDRHTTEQMYLQQAVTGIKEHILAIGTFQSCLPQEAALTYLVLPEPLQKKFLHLQRKESIGPCSYQLAVAQMWKKHRIQDCIHDWYVRKEAANARLENLVKKELSEFVTIEKRYSYITNGIVIHTQPLLKQEVVYSICERAGIRIEGVKDYWYFHRDTGENLFALQGENNQFEQAFAQMRILFFQQIRE